MTFLYKANATRGMEWARFFAARAPDLPFRLWPDVGDPAQVRYLAVWAPPENIAATFRNLELVFSVGAGSINSISRGSRPMFRSSACWSPASRRAWLNMSPWPCSHCIVISCSSSPSSGSRPGARSGSRRPGNGKLASWASACSVRRCLSGSSYSAFRLRAGTRSPRAIQDVSCYAGGQALSDFLAQADILVCLLPLTSQTRGILTPHIASMTTPVAVTRNHRSSPPRRNLAGPWRS